MQQSILGKRRAIAINNLASQLERLTGESIDLTSGLRGNSEHRQLHMLERLNEFLSGVETAGKGYTLDEILAIEGLSKTSQKAIEAVLGE